ncbi:MAG TPA: BsuPI-related putative proteinase inhibitor [Longimicrobiales bacterium]
MRGASGRRVAVLLAGLGLGAGCGSTPAAEGVVTPSGDLAATMEVDVGDESTTLRLHVTNVSDHPVELEFTSGQRYDFAVTTEDGESVWTWSADKSFMQALGTETLAPGASLRFSEAWPSNGLRGRYIAVGRITSTNEPVQQSVIFDLHGGE